MNAVKDGKMGYLKASKLFEVPKITLRRYVKNGETDPAISVYTPLGRKPILLDVLEQKLVKYCIDMDNRFFGLRRADLMRMAYQVALGNNIPNPFNGESARRTWFINVFKKISSEIMYSNTSGNLQRKNKKIHPTNCESVFLIYMKMNLEK